MTRGFVALAALCFVTAALATPVAAAAVPAAPTGVSAAPENAQAKVSWTAPADNGSAITAYVVTPYIGNSAQPSRTFNSTATTQSVTGLTNGTNYTFKIAAKNANGTGPKSVSTNAVRVGAPAAPTGESATPGNAQATLSWTAPADNGSAITAYVVTPYIGANAQPVRQFNSTAPTQNVTGLTNGTTYTFKIAAQNARGTGPQSAGTNAVTAGAPVAPTAVSATPGNSQATVSWTAPSNNNGSAITAYVITPLIGYYELAPSTFTSTATTQIVTGLTNGTTYRFKIAAKNARGTGRQSVATNAVVVGAPAAPTAPSATPGNAQATVKWTTPSSNNGSAITGYVVTPYIAGAAQPARTFTSTATTQIVTGLTNGTSYTFKVAATNANGTGLQSVATNAVTPSPISFGKSLLQGTSSTGPTVARFGRDGRLYVAQFDGLIKAYTVARNAVDTYAVTNTETIAVVQQIPNHDDDGTLNPSVTTRLITGLLVVGSASNPVIYVASSDPRVGGGPDGTETNLDTNSGVISRVTKDTNGWQRRDVVRGLPRSEENHATNALVLDQATNTLYVAQGGNTNMGAPSHNFSLLPEYAYSAAILTVDLDAIGSATYDLPTLNSDNYPNLVGPFGGDRGNRQAKITASSPVQVYAPGFRNPFSLVRRESGGLYAFDNGPNAGWGDIPVGEGPGGQCTNEANEPGASQPDTLHLITGPGYYAGHPNPTRGNGANTFNTINPQSPVEVANPIECDARTPSTNGSIGSLNTATTGMAEYTTSNLSGQLDGDLITASYYGAVLRVRLNAAGTSIVSSDFLFSNVGTHPIDVVVQRDSDAYPGTMWVPDIADGRVYVFEPADFGGRVPPPCGGADSTTLDEDLDGYTNADEIDNGTDPCSNADVPHDWNRNFVSDGNDPNDDSDGLPDASDPFALDPGNGLSTDIPISYSWQNGATGNPCAPTPFPSGCPGGLLGLGFTGLMSNGATTYEGLYDVDNMTVGGAAGVLTISQVPPGDATGSTNTQQYAFQYGVNANPANTGVFTVHTRVDAPFAGATPQGNQSIGLYIGSGDQDNYAKVVLTANGGSPGIQYVKESGGVVAADPVSPLPLPGPDFVDLYLTVDPVTSAVVVRYRITTNGISAPLITLGAPHTIPAWCTSTARGLAVGLIATSTGGPTFPATWSVLEVTSGAPAS